MLLPVAVPWQRGRAEDIRHEHPLALRTWANCPKAWQFDGTQARMALKPAK